MLSIPNKPSLLLSSAVFTDLTLLICGAVVSINVFVVEILRVVLFPAISTISPLTFIESFSTNSFKASISFLVIEAKTVPPITLLDGSTDTGEPNFS